MRRSIISIKNWCTPPGTIHGRCRLSQVHTEQPMESICGLRVRFADGSWVNLLTERSSGHPHLSIVSHFDPAYINPRELQCDPPAGVVAYLLTFHAEGHITIRWPDGRNTIMGEETLDALQPSMQEASQ